MCYLLDQTEREMVGAEEVSSSCGVRSQGTQGDDKHRGGPSVD